MGAPPAAGMVIRRCHTAELDAGDVSAIRRLLAAAFTDLTEEDWTHSLGGMHALVVDDGRLVAHGSLVMRRLLVGDRSLRCGYVEAVATDPELRGRGHGAAVMAALEELAPAYDLLALSSTAAGLPFYLARGWQPWRGPTYVVSPGGLVRTPEDDGSVLVLSRGVDLDLDAALACDWRDGDVW